MNLLYIWLYSSLLYVYVGANGIVKTIQKDGEERAPTDFLEQGARYKQFLECSYTHNYESIVTTKGIKKPTSTKHQHVFFLQCLELEDSDEKFVVLYFNSLAVDRMVVTSCDKGEIERSIFPQRLEDEMGRYYRDVHRHVRERVSPRFRFLKEEDDNCYDRRYTVRLTKEDTEEFELIQRKSPTVVTIRGPECGEVKFINCRAPTTDLQDIITEYLDVKAKIFAIWFAYIRDNDLAIDGDGKDVIIRETTQCTVQYPGPKSSDVYDELVCVKVEVEKGYTYFAFVSQGDSDGFYIERFTVKSCREDGLVNAIFPVRKTDNQSKKRQLRFKYNGKCYERNYVPGLLNGKPKEIGCPSNVLDWVNPKEGGSAMWSNCKKILNPLEKLSAFK